MNVLNTTRSNEIWVCFLCSSKLSAALHLWLCWSLRAPSCCTCRPLPVRSQCSSSHTAASPADRKWTRNGRSLCVRRPRPRLCNNLPRGWSPKTPSPSQWGSAGQRTRPQGHKVLEKRAEGRGLLIKTWDWLHIQSAHLTN